MTIASTKENLPTRTTQPMLERTNGQEIAPTAVAAQFQAMIQARFALAYKFPRNMDEVRRELLRECSRPDFAMNKSTLYRKPVGRGVVEGLGIRFAEAAALCMRNVVADAFTIQDSETERIIYSFVFDLERNVSWGKTVTLPKTVERSKPADDGSYISVRQNTSGRDVYLIPATDDDLLIKENSWVSKANRNGILRLMPGWLLEECEKKIREVRKGEIEKDPDSAKNAVVDAFDKLNVTVPMLEDFLEHPLDQCSPAEIDNLRAIYGTIDDGEATWKAVMENREEMRTLKKKPKTEAKKPERGVDAVKSKVAEQDQKKAETAAAKPPPPEEKKDPAPRSSTEEPPEFASEVDSSPPFMPEAAASEPADAKPVATEKPVKAKAAAKKTVEATKPKKIQGINFPAHLTHDGDDEHKATELQIKEAHSIITKINEARPDGPQFTLEKTMESWDLPKIEEQNSNTMGNVIDALNVVLEKITKK